MPPRFPVPRYDGVNQDHLSWRRAVPPNGAPRPLSTMSKTRMGFSNPHRNDPSNHLDFKHFKTRLFREVGRVDARHGIVGQQA